MIHIFYRATSYLEIGYKCRPHFFSLEKCFKNFLDTLDPTKTNLTVIFDGPIENSFILKYQNKYLFDIHQINAGTDFKSNTMTFEYIKNQPIKNNEIVYILEQDYLHLPWIDAVEFLYKTDINYNINNSYISLYDHADKYTRNDPTRQNTEWGMYHDLKSQIYYTPYRYVRTVPSTCGSFLLSKQLFDKDYEVHTSGQADNTRFGILTKEPYNRIVLSFMPGLSTHLHTHFMSPLIDWQTINQKTILSE
jgi:hypothetical protein